MKFVVLLFLSILTLKYSYAQLNYDFETEIDLNTWIGDTSQYLVSEGKLKLDGVSQSSLILHPSTAIDSAMWEFDFTMLFNPSANNYLLVYLVVSSDTVADSEGYYLKAGGSLDNFSLYRFDNSGSTLIINGREDRLDHSTINASVQVTRSVDGHWEILSKINQESNFTLEGEAIDLTFYSASFFGIQCVYTSTRKDKFYFDNIRVSGVPYQDRIPPEITSVEVISNNSILITFSEPVDISNSDFEIKYPVLKPDSIKDERNYILLYFDSDLPNATNLSLVHSGFEDLNGNTSVSRSFEFFCFFNENPNPGDVIFSEIMADPTPPVDLPESEYIEIFNRSDKYFNLSKWTLSDNKTNVILDSVVLAPNDYLLLVPDPIDYYLASPINIIVTSKWPSLNNSGDTIRLFSNDSLLIDHLGYSLSSYQDEIKSTGGWSIEIIDPMLPCRTKTNWIASENLNGGTPGFVNSFQKENGLDILGNYTINAKKLAIEFNKAIKCDHLNLNSTIVNNLYSSCSDNILYIESKEEFPANLYTFEINQLQDCYNNYYDFSFETIIDYSPPEIVSVSNLYHNQLEIVFTEPVASIFEITIGEMDLDVIRYDQRTDSISVNSDALSPGKFSMHIELEDTLHNRSEINNEVIIEEPYVAKFTDLVITEYLPSPNEDSELPYEFIEIFNRTKEVIPLRGYHIGDATKSAQIEDGYINPNEYLILCAASSFEDYLKHGKVIPIRNWPAINNNYESIELLNPFHELVYQVEYDPLNFTDEISNSSIEKIDLNRFCNDRENWNLSSSISGGTPGKKNSIEKSNPDRTPPSIVSSHLIKPNKVQLDFSEPIHPYYNFQLNLSSNIELDSINRIGPNRFEAILSKPLVQNTNNQYKIDHLVDCNNNLADNISGGIIVPGVPEKGDLIINEILYNPDPLVSEFIEILNSSTKYIQLSSIEIEIHQSTTSLIDGIISPNEFIVLSRDPESLLNRYQYHDESSFQFFNLPSLRNDSSTIKLYSDGLLLDSAKYNEDWHFELIDNPKGVSLERISPSSDGFKRSSWFSASSTSGFATPGKINSHFKGAPETQNIFSIEPKTISPNNDGFQDIAFINYNIKGPGFMANLRIFDTRGNLIKEIANNVLLQSQGYFNWDGTDQSGSSLETDYYILFIELFDNSGFLRREKFKIGLFQNNF